MTFEAWIKAKGWDPTALSDEQRVTLRAAYDASGTGGGSGNPGQGHGTGNSPITGTGGRLNEIKLEQMRRDAIEAAAVAEIKRGGDIVAIEAAMNTAITAGTDARTFELNLLRERRVAPDNHGTREPQVTGDVLECALAVTANLPGVEKMFSEQTLQRARDQYPNGITLMELVVKAARRAGFVTDSFRMSKSLLQAAFAPIAARGASTYDLSGVLSNVANKAIRAGFDSVESTWRQVSAIGTVTDFKEITRYALTGDFLYEQVGPGGELKSATMGEQSYGNKADTYGKIFAITRQDFINDDLSAFDRVRMLIGRGGALKFNLVFWTEFLRAVTAFYTTGRGNYFEGGTTNLQSSSLTSAVTLFRKQTDPDGNPLGINPAILLVPPEEEVTADELYVSTNLNSGGAATKEKIPNRNVHANKYRPVVSSYLSNANITNYSTTHWFLLADPMDMPVIESVFLNGRQQPIVEAADADFDMLGVQMRGYHDFGVRQQEYRGGVRSKGAA